MAALISALVVGLLSWLFSGSKKTVARHTAPGLEGLDRETLTGVHDE